MYELSCKSHFHDLKIALEQVQASFLTAVPGPTRERARGQRAAGAPADGRVLPRERRLVHPEPRARHAARDEWVPGAVLRRGSARSRGVASMGCFDPYINSDIWNPDDGLCWG